MIRLIYDVLVDTTDLHAAIVELGIPVHSIFTVEGVPTARLIDEDGIEIADPDSLMTQTIVCVDDTMESKIKEQIDGIIRQMAPIDSTVSAEKIYDVVTDEKREI